MNAAAVLLALLQAAACLLALAAGCYALSWLGCAALAYRRTRILRKEGWLVTERYHPMLIDMNAERSTDETDERFHVTVTWFKFSIQVDRTPPVHG